MMCCGILVTIFQLINQLFITLYLTEVYKQFVFINLNSYKESKKVFDVVFNKVKKQMEQQCPFFKDYGREVLNAGSVRNHIKVTSLNEFDMDLVIRLPIHADAVDIESDVPAYIRLKVGKQFDDLKKQPKWQDSHKILDNWSDSDSYMLQNEFRKWMHSLVARALDELGHEVTIEDDDDSNGSKYSVTFREAGPSYTLNIKGNSAANADFYLDVNLVPVLKFCYPKWPGLNYRSMPKSVTKFIKTWLVVPKPHKTFEPNNIKRHWRLSFQEFERYMMKNSERLKPTIRMIKKLRDSLELTEIASYYINTLFFWKIKKEEANLHYWHKSLSELFCIMVEELYNAIKNKCIPYFWHDEDHCFNLIECVNVHNLNIYEEKLRKVVGYIYSQDVNNIISCLLTKKELESFHNSEFYKKRNGKQTAPMALSLKAHTTRSLSSDRSSPASARFQLENVPSLFSFPMVSAGNPHRVFSRALKTSTNVKLNTTTDSPSDIPVNKISKFLVEVGEYLPGDIKAELENIVSANRRSDTPEPLPIASTSKTKNFMTMANCRGETVENTAESLMYKGAGPSTDTPENSVTKQHIQNFLEETGDAIPSEIIAELEEIVNSSKREKETLQNKLETNDMIKHTAEVDEVIGLMSDSISRTISEDSLTVGQIQIFLDESGDSIPSETKAELESIVSAAQHMLKLNKNDNDAEYLNMEMIQKFLEDAGDSIPDEIRAELESIVSAANSFLKLDDKMQYNATSSQVEYHYIKPWFMRALRYLSFIFDLIPSAHPGKYACNLVGSRNIKLPSFHEDKVPTIGRPRPHPLYERDRDSASRREEDVGIEDTWESCTDVAQLNQFDDDEEIEW